MRHYLTIVDRDCEYADKLAEYLNAEEGFPFLVNSIALRDEEDLSVEGIDLFLVDEELYGSAKEKIPKDKLIVMTGGLSGEYENIKQLGKYQRAGLMIRDILNFASQIRDISLLVSRKSALKIIIFYSPVKRCGQSSLSRRVGELLSQNTRTLYMNMESYSGLEGELGREIDRDAGDYMYSHASGQSNCTTVLAGIIEKIKGLDILPSIRGHDEMASISIDQWKELLKNIENDTDYEYLIVDLGDGVQGLGELLSEADRVVTVSSADPVSLIKLEEYEQMLKRKGYEAICNKTIKWQSETPKEEIKILLDQLIGKDAYAVN